MRFAKPHHAHDADADAEEMPAACVEHWYSMRQRHNRWAMVLFACLALGAFLWVGMDWTGYVQTWVGSLFRAASGGALGWMVSRYVVGLDLSAIAEDRRPVAAISQAMLIAAGSIAVAMGV